MKGHIQLAKALIETFKMSIHSVNCDGNTPLHLSSLLRQEESVRLLLYEYHAPMFVRNKAGQTALDLASTNIASCNFTNEHHHRKLKFEF